MTLDEYLAQANFQWREPESKGIARRVLTSTHRRTWIERRESWTLDADPTTGPVDIVCGYALDGAYIGEAENARYLESVGIVPQRRNPEANVASVGFCPSDGLWYGWSHRAIRGCATRAEADDFAESVASGRAPKPGSAAARLEELCAVQATAGHHGDGWWWADVPRRLFQISDVDLGPHGDHDGWVVIDQHAKALGVDATAALAYVMSTYGASDARFHAAVPEDYKGDGAHVYSPDEIDGYPPRPEYELAFRERFGQSYLAARRQTFPKLLRVRLWGNGLLTITGRGVPSVDVWRRCRDAMAKELDDEVRAVNRVELSDPARDFYETLDRDQWLLFRHGMKMGGV